MPLTQARMFCCVGGLGSLGSSVVHAAPDPGSPPVPAVEEGERPKKES